MKREISIYLKDILDNMNKTEKFTKGMNYKNFVKDEKTFYAVIRCLEIIGEAVKHIPDEIRNKYPEIPWKDIAGMRDKVIHFYFGINFEQIWLVLTNDIPKLKPFLIKIIHELGFDDK